MGCENIKTKYKVCEKKVKGAKIFWKNLRGAKISGEKIRGAKISGEKKGVRNFLQFSGKDYDRVSGLKNDPPLMLIKTKTTSIKLSVSGLPRG